MKKKAFLIFLPAVLAVVPAHAATRTKATTGTELTDSGSWDTLPGSGDVAAWAAASNVGAQTVASDVTWNSMSFSSLSGDLTLSGAGKINLALNSNSEVISASSAGNAVTIGNEIILNSNAGATVAVGATTNRVQIQSGGNNLTFGKITATGGALASDANVMFRGTGGTITVNDTLTIDGQMYKGDSGTVTLNAANSIGWVYINNGTLRAGDNAAFGSGTIYTGGGSSFTLASADSTTRSFTNALDFATVSSYTGTASFGQTSGGTGTLAFSGNVNLGAAARSITTNVDTTFSGVISGTGGGITKAGTGTLTLTGTNTHTGVTAIAAGVLAAGNDNVFGTSQIKMNGGTIASSDSSGRTFTTGKFIDFAASSTFGTATTGNLKFNDTMSIGGQSKTATIANGTTEFAGVISATADNTNAFTKTGAGTLILSGANTYNRPTTVIAGSLGIGNNTAVGSGTNAVLSLGGTNADTPTIFASGGARTIANNVVLLATSVAGNPTVSGTNNLTFSGTTTASGAARTLSVNNTGVTTLVGNVFLSDDDTTSGRGLTINGTGNTTISGVIANNNVGNTLAASFTKDGSGTLTLSGTNTYTGTTTVSGGSLVISGNSSAANGAASVTAGSLYVTGQLGGSVTVSAGATVGGDGIIGALTLNGTSTLDISTLNTAMTTGNITFASTGFGVDNLIQNGLAINWASVANGTYDLLSGDIVSGTFEHTVSNQFNIGSGRSAYFQEGSLQLVVVPEPSALLLGGLGAFALLRRRR